jgi:hypothetical protein
MYGLLLNSMFEVIRQRVGDDRWPTVKMKAGIDVDCPLEPLSINCESWVVNLMEAAQQETGISSNEVSFFFYSVD